MKKNIAKYTFLLLLLGSCEALISFNSVSNGNKDVAILNTVLRVLESNHYAPKDIDDSLSTKMFDLYLDRIDYSKRFLTKKDYKKLEKYRYSLDNEIAEKKFDFFNLSNEIIAARITEVQSFYEEILKEEISLNQTDRDLNLDPKKIDYVKNTSTLKKRWSDYLTYNIYNEIYNLDKKQKSAAEKSDTVKIKSLGELEQEARAKVLKNHVQWFKRLTTIERHDRLSIYFNCLTELFDPHTNFYPPKDKENFDISISGRLEGSLDEAVQLIRGPKGSEVRLTVRKIDGEEIVVPIIRDIVVLEETYARSAIIEDEETGLKTGYIYLPKFYADFSKRNGRNCSTDVQKEIEKLKKEDVDGIVMDLRDNGGGSLRDVVSIGGFFIEEGPIVQVKSRYGSPYVLDDPDSKVLYAGPLVVMINQSSASASEILAAAVQDYNRGIVIGSASSYGKGTVQRFDDLDNYLNSSDESLKPIGSIKFTMQKFYRINGGATQLKGVESDVVIPDNFTYIKTGEREIKHAMPWDEVQKANYKDYSSYLGDKNLIIKNSQERIKKDSIFQLYDARAAYYKEARENLTYPLSYDLFKKKLDKEKEASHKYDSIKVEIDGINVGAIKADESAWSGDTTKVASFDEFSGKIAKDKYIFEATKVIKDIIEY